MLSIVAFLLVSLLHAFQSYNREAALIDSLVAVGSKSVSFTKEKQSEQDADIWYGDGFCFSEEKRLSLEKALKSRFQRNTGKKFSKK